MQAEERERDKGNASKDDAEGNAATKRRKLKRDHLSSMEAGEYAPAAPLPPPSHVSGASQRSDGRESGERKAAMAQSRAAYAEEPVQRAASKIPRRDAEQYPF